MRRVNFLLDFFRAVDEPNLLNRIDLLAAEQGVMVDYTMELRTLLYLSDAVADRVNKREQARKMAERKAAQNKGR